jgi:hypothetical protein
MTERKTAFLLAFGASGSITNSARLVGIDRKIHYDWLAKDSNYKAAFETTLAQRSHPDHIDSVRDAIHTNRISFPAQIPVFAHQFRPEIQRRLVDLYFIRNWSTKQLAERYKVTPRRIQQSLQNWADCAIACGYLQEIPADDANVVSLGRS